MANNVFMGDPGGELRRLANAIAAHDGAMKDYLTEIGGAVNKLRDDLGITGMKRNLSLPQQIEFIRETLVETFAAIDRDRQRRGR